MRMLEEADPNSSTDRKQRLTAFARSLLLEWKRLALPMRDETVVAGVSGGADSVALLLALSELVEAGKLKLKIVAAHLDHGLRAESGEDARWVASLGRSLGIEVASARTDVSARAASSGDNLEQAARLARYEFLNQTATANGSRLVLTAHTVDDQAETVLMKLIRGSGTDGLAGIAHVRRLNKGGEALLARPLLSWARRSATEAYCYERRAGFLRDPMNEDESYARVRVRKRVLPLLQELNPKASENIARASLLFQEDAAALAAQAELLLERARAEAPPSRDEDSSAAAEKGNIALNVETLVSAPSAVRKRALRLWLESLRGDLRRIERVHILAVERLLSPGRGGRIAELPGGGSVERQGRFLIFCNINR